MAFHTNSEDSNCTDRETLTETVHNRSILEHFLDFYFLISTRFKLFALYEELPTFDTIYYPMAI